jgi:hypothetical protein
VVEGNGADASEVAEPTPTTGEAIAAWKSGGQVYLVVRVAGDGLHGEDVEYVGMVSEEDLARLSAQEQRLALLAAVKAVRDRQRALDAVDVRGLVGAVAL